MRPPLWLGRLVAGSLLAGSAVVVVAAPPAAATGPYDQARNCIDPTVASTAVPTVAGQRFAVLVTESVAPEIGADLQSSLVSHQVSRLLLEGIGHGPRTTAADPNRRVPVYVTAGVFDTAEDEGVMARMCNNTAIDGVVVRANLDSAAEVAAATAHELFHAFSRGRSSVGVANWFEEAAATWFQGVAGYGEETGYDAALKPKVPLDFYVNGAPHQYAMSRFLQYLEDQALVRNGDSWPLIRAVIDGYGTPGPTKALEAYLESRRGIGLHSAAFWGERMKRTPRHGPTIARAEYTSVTLDAGETTKSSTMGRLETRARKFALADGVQRVTFEYDLPSGTYAFGLPDPAAEPIRIEDGDIVSFCRLDGDGDDYKFPRIYRTTLTNGRTAVGDLTAKVEIRATTRPRGCTGSAYNDACQLIRDSGIKQIYSPGEFVDVFQDRGEDVDTFFCIRARHTDANAFELVEAKWRNTTAKRLRRLYRRIIEESPDYRPVDVGDVAGIWVDNSGEHPVVSVIMLVHKIAVIFVTGGGRSDGIDLARRLARHM